MIVSMRKYSFLVYHAVYTDFLQKLRETGVLHVAEKQSGQVAENSELRARMDESKRITTMLRFLEPLRNKEIALADAKDVDGMALLASLEKTFQKRNELNLKIQGLQKDIDAASIWGHFRWADIEALKKAGCRVDFFSCAKASWQPEWENLYHLNVVLDNGSQVYFVCFSLSNQMPDIAADRVRMSSRSLAELQAEMKSLQGEYESLAAILAKAANEEVNTLKHTLDLVQDDYQFSKVILETEKTAADKVMLLEGYVPEDKEAELKAMLEESQVYYQAEAVDYEDTSVPVKLKNNWFSKLYEPITNMYSLPNYGELDPTPFLAPFFMLFFGLCMGDGGYGLLIIAACLLARKKLSESMRVYCDMGITMGICTTVVGILTGAFFGMSLDAVEWPWLKGVKHYFLTQANYGDKLGGYNPMMFVAVIIGVIQILFGMFINVAKISHQRGIKYALSSLAWAVGIILLLVTFGLPMLTGNALPAYLTYVLYGLLGICALLIVFYNSPDKNIFINIGASLWDTYNMASGLLGDVLSYIRLFALGLTGSILGGVFNTMAFDMTGAMPPYLRWLAVLAILLVGHAINFAMALIGALVHPMRLTFVEFYKNAGFEGGGKAYSPFKRKAKK